MQILIDVQALSHFMGVMGVEHKNFLKSRQSGKLAAFSMSKNSHANETAGEFSYSTSCPFSHSGKSEIVPRALSLSSRLL